MKFTIRDWMLVTVIVALAVIWQLGILAGCGTVLLVRT